MKARMPGGYGRPDMSSLMRQALKMQSDMQATQAELEQTEYTASAPGEMVTPAKMYKLAGAAKQWLAENGVRNKPCRFDVVIVLGEEIEHIEGAFDMDDAARGAYSVFKHRG